MVVSSVLFPLPESEGGCRQMPYFTELVLFCVKEAVGSEVMLSEASSVVFMFRARIESGLR